MLDCQTDCFKIDKICLSVVNPSSVRWTLDGQTDCFKIDTLELRRATTPCHTVTVNVDGDGDGAGIALKKLVGTAGEINATTTVSVAQRSIILSCSRR